jgi:hypothetical protein
MRNFRALDESRSQLPICSKTKEKKGLALAKHNLSNPFQSAKRMS